MIIRYIRFRIAMRKMIKKFDLIAKGFPPNPNKTIVVNNLNPPKPIFASLRTYHYPPPTEILQKGDMVRGIHLPGEFIVAEDTKLDALFTPVIDQNGNRVNIRTNILMLIKEENNDQ